jgi:hypothetical protein
MKKTDKANISQIFFILSLKNTFVNLVKLIQIFSFNNKIYIFLIIQKNKTKIKFKSQLIRKNTLQRYLIK